jgi:hypothetical protein
MTSRFTKKSSVSVSGSVGEHTVLGLPEAGTYCAQLHRRGLSGLEVGANPSAFGSSGANESASIGCDCFTIRAGRVTRWGVSWPELIHLSDPGSLVKFVQPGRDSSARSDACSVMRATGPDRLLAGASQTIGKRLVAVQSAPASYPRSCRSRTRRRSPQRLDGRTTPRVPRLANTGSLRFARREPCLRAGAGICSDGVCVARSPAPAVGASASGDDFSCRQGSRERCGAGRREFCGSDGRGPTFC